MRKVIVLVCMMAVLVLCVCGWTGDVKAEGCQHLYSNAPVDEAKDVYAAVDNQRHEHRIETWRYITCKNCGEIKEQECIDSTEPTEEPHRYEVQNGKWVCADCGYEYAEQAGLNATPIPIGEEVTVTLTAETDHRLYSFVAPETGFYYPYTDEESSERYRASIFVYNSDLTAAEYHEYDYDPLQSPVKMEKNKLYYIYAKSINDYEPLGSTPFSYQLEMSYTGRVWMMLINSNDYYWSNGGPASPTDLFADVTIADGEGTLKYRWFEVTPATEGGTETLVQIAETDTPTLSLPYSDRIMTLECQVSDDNFETICDLSRVNVFPSWDFNAAALSPETVYVDPNSTDVVTMQVGAAIVCGEIEYQWEKWNGTTCRYEEIQGAENASYTAAAETDPTTGKRRTEKYRCRITHHLQREWQERYVNFEIRSGSGLILIEDNGVEMYPQAGSEVELQIGEVIGEGMSYQWYDSSDHWYYYYDTDIDYGTPIAGATGATYTYTTDTRSRLLTCSVTDQYGCEAHKAFYVYPRSDGSGEDDDFTLTMSAGGKPVSVNWGEVKVSESEQNVTLSVTAAPEGDDYTYRWYTRSDGPMEFPINAQGNSITIAEPKEGINYFCEVTKGQTSRIAVVYFTITDGFTLEAVEDDEYCTVNGGYGNVNAPAGTPVTLKVRARDKGGELIESGIDYRWYKCDYDYGYSQIEIGTGDQLEIIVPRRSYTEYRCTASDGKSDSYAYFDFSPRQKQVANPLTVTASGGTSIETDGSEPVTLAVHAAGGGGTLSYNWYRTTRDAGNPSGETHRKLAGNGESITLSGAELIPGRYTCMVTDGTTSDSVCFTVSVESALTAETAEAVFTVAPGGTATMTVNATCGAGRELSYQWYQIGDRPGNRVAIPDGTEASYTTKPLLNSGYYCCVVSDGINQKEVDFTIKVMSLNVTADGGTWIYPIYNDDVTLKVIANNGKEGAVFSYYWFEQWYDETNHSTTKQRIQGANGNEYTFKAVNNHDYYCMVVDEYGYRGSVYFDVTVQAPISYNWPATEFTVEEGGNAELAIEAWTESGAPLTYYWSRAKYDADGEELARETLTATTDSITIENITERQTVWCEVRSVSDYRYFEFHINVNGGLATEALTDQRVSVDQGESVTFAVNATTRKGTVGYRWTASLDRYNPEWGYWYQSSETLEAEAELTIDSVDATGWYYCTIFTEYESVTYSFNIEHVWSPEIITGETMTTYEWCSPEEHKAVTRQKMHKACIGPGCTATLEIEDGNQTETPGAHTPDENGICTVCQMKAEGDWDGQIQGIGYSELVITGYGEVTAKKEWAQYKSGIQRITIGKDITRIKTGAFAGFNSGVRVDFLGKKLPEIEAGAFSNTTAVCRYYNNDASWTTAGQYGGTLTWKQLTVYWRNDSEYLYYGRNSTPGWEIYGERLKDGNWGYFRISEAEAMEQAFRSKNIYVYHGSVTINGDVDELMLLGNSNTGDTVRVNGNVGSLCIHDSSMGTDAYKGTVYVTGTVAHGTVQGMGTIMIPKIGENGSDLAISKSMVTRLFDNVKMSTPIAAGGTILVEGVHELAAYTKENCTLRYHLYGIGQWGLYMQPKNDPDKAEIGIDSLEEYKAGFGTEDVYYGANTELIVYDQGSAEDSLAIGNGNETAIRRMEIYRSYVQINLKTDDLYVDNSHILVNATVGELTVSDQRNEAGLYSDVTINNRVQRLTVNNRIRKNMNVHTATSGMIDSCELYVPLLGYRETGRIDANTQIYANGQMPLMSRGDGDTLEAILPANAEMDTVSGFSGNYFAAVDIRETDLDWSDNAAVKTLTMSEQWNTPAVKQINMGFRIVLAKGWSDEYGNVYYESEINEPLNGMFTVRIQNPVDGNSRIVKLEEDGNGGYTATPVEATLEGQVMTFRADRAGRYVIVSDTAMPKPLGWSYDELYWYTGLSTEEPETNGIYGTDRIGVFWIPDYDREEGADDPVWSVVPDSEGAPDCFRTVSVYNDRYFAGIQPKEGAVLTAGDWVYRLNAEYNGISYYRDVTVHISSAIPMGMDARIAQVDPETESIGEWQAISSPQELTTGNIYAIRLNLIGGEGSGEDEWEWSNDTYCWDSMLHNKDKWEYKDDEGNSLLTGKDCCIETINPGTTQVTARLNRNNGNIQIKKTLTVSVSAVYGSLADELAFSVPVLVTPDEPFTISVTGRDGTNTVVPDRMTVKINDLEYNYQAYSGEELKSNMITVPARDAYQNTILQGTGRRYQATVTAYKTGWIPMSRDVLMITGDLNEMQTLKLPDSLTRIEDYAFAGGAFEAVIIPDGCTYIGEHAFDGCDQLVYISYPASYENGGIEIRESAFDGCGEIVPEVR